jgi:hypothetical protein
LAALPAAATSLSRACRAASSSSGRIGAPIFLRGRGQRFHGLTPEGAVWPNGRAASSRIATPCARRS